MSSNSRFDLRSAKALYWFLSFFLSVFFSKTKHGNMFCLPSKEACLYAGANWLSTSVNQRVARDNWPLARDREFSAHLDRRSKQHHLSSNWQLQSASHLFSKSVLFTVPGNVFALKHWLAMLICTLQRVARGQLSWYITMWRRYTDTRGDFRCTAVQTLNITEALHRHTFQPTMTKYQKGGGDFLDQGEGKRGAGR